MQDLRGRTRLLVFDSEHAFAGPKRLRYRLVQVVARITRG